MAAILALPQELVDEITSYLPPSDIFHLLQTCRTLRVRVASCLHTHAITQVSELPALHWAVREGKVPLLRYLLRFYPVDLRLHDGSTPLHVAVKVAASVEVLKLLFASGASINAVNHKSRTPLIYLCGNKRASLEQLQLLLRNGADMNLRDNFNNTPVFAAVTAFRDDFAVVLIKQGADILNPRYIPSRNTLLHMAATFDRLSLLTALLSTGANGNCTNTEGVTPLLLATQNGNIGCVQRLIAAGVELDATDGNGRTALFVAIIWQRPEIAVRLVRAGAECDMPDEQGDTPLEKACKCGYDQLVRVLLRRGCFDMNREGLMAAARSGHKRIVDMLLEDRWKRGIEARRRSTT